MPSDKWNFALPDPDEPPVEKVERGGMIVVLSIGLILFIGGLIFAWKINAFDAKTFFASDVEPILQNRGLGLYIYLAYFHFPWIAGVWLIKTAVKYFCKKH